MKLRNFNKYLKRIEKWIALSNLKMELVPEHEDGGDYNPNTRSITVDGSQSESEIISTLLHEMGHYLDDLRNPTRLSNTHHWHGRTKIEESATLTVNQKASVWHTELAAWKNAEAIARQLGIPLGAWFWKDKQASLNTYRPIRTE